VGEAGTDDPKPTVLLVEDDPSIRQLVRINFEMAGFHVVEARDGLEGLLMADLHQPEAIVLDLMMPDVDGARMLAQLRGLPGGEDVPVVVITGKADVSEDVHRMAGPGNVLAKPFDPDDLVARIRHVAGLG
jgi:two-component system response regulator RpaA